MTARCSCATPDTGKPSLRQMHPSTATLLSASRRAARLVLCSPRASIPGAQRVTIDTRAARLRITGYRAARPSGVCCLESLSIPSARAWAGPMRLRSSSTPAATSGPARQPRPASSAPATKRTPSPRSKPSSRRPGRAGLRRLPLEGADAARGPVGEERDPDEPFIGDGAPETAVVRETTVVAHHEVMTGRNLDRRPEIAGTVHPAGVDVAILLLDPVAVDVAILDEDHVTRSRHDALDEGLGGLLGRRLVAGRVVAGALRGVPAHRAIEVGPMRRVKHDDVTDAGVVGESVGEHPLARIQRWHHR